MRPLVAWLLILLFSLAHASDETERAQIRQRGDAIEAEHALREQTCRKQFVVTPCLDKARADKQESLRALRAQELALDDAQRRERALAQANRVAEKTQLRDQAKPAPPPKRPHAPAAPKAVKPPKAQASAAAADRSAEEQSHRAAFEARQREIQVHRAEVEKRNTERAKHKAPKPLPAPASAVQP